MEIYKKMWVGVFSEHSVVTGEVILRWKWAKVTRNEGQKVFAHIIVKLQSINNEQYRNDLRSISMSLKTFRQR